MGQRGTFPLPSAASLPVRRINHMQIEEEVLALVFGVNRFHQYLYGRKFYCITDHKPLTF